MKMNKFKTIGLVLMISPLLLLFYASQPGTSLSFLTTGTGYVGNTQNVRWLVDETSFFPGGVSCFNSYAIVKMYDPQAISSVYDFPTDELTLNSPSGHTSNYVYYFDYSFTPQKVGTYTIKFTEYCGDIISARESKTITIKSKPTTSPSPTPPVNECSPGESSKTCSGSNAIIKSCDGSGSWVTATQNCQYGCNAGACMSCTPNDVKKVCDGSTLVTKVCSSTGSWESSNTQECQNGCSNGACLIESSETQPNETQNTSLETNVTTQENQTNVPSNENNTSIIIKSNEQGMSMFTLKLWLERDDLYKGVKNMTVLMSSGLFLFGLFLYLKGGRK